VGTAGVLGDTMNERTLSQGGKRAKENRLFSNVRAEKPSLIVRKVKLTSNDPSGLKERIRKAELLSEDRRAIIQGRQSPSHPHQGIDSEKALRRAFDVGDRTL